MASFNDQELLKEFLIESNEHLTAIEPDLLLLEKSGTQTSQEVINRIFRAIHSIKGSAGFFGFDNGPDAVGISGRDGNSHLALKPFGHATLVGNFTPGVSAIHRFVEAAVRSAAGEAPEITVAFPESGIENSGILSIHG